MLREIEGKLNWKSTSRKTCFGVRLFNRKIAGEQVQFARLTQESPADYYQLRQPEDIVVHMVAYPVKSHILA